MVEVMRRGDYPGSELIIEQTLDPGDNYDRYIAHDCQSPPTKPRM